MHLPQVFQLRQVLVSFSPGPQGPALDGLRKFSPIWEFTWDWEFIYMFGTKSLCGVGPGNLWILLSASMVLVLPGSPQVVVKNAEAMLFNCSGGSSECWSRWIIRSPSHLGGISKAIPRAHVVMEFDPRHERTSKH